MTTALTCPPALNRPNPQTVRTCISTILSRVRKPEQPQSVSEESGVFEAAD